MKPSSFAILGTSIALLALWIASWALSSVDLGRWSVAVALAIAAVKASLVALIFMELSHVRASVRLAAAAALGMVGLLLTLVVVDVVARGAQDRARGNVNENVAPEPTLDSAQTRPP